MSFGSLLRSALQPLALPASLSALAWIGASPSAAAEEASIQIAFDQSTYAPGQPATLTISGTPGQLVWLLLDLAPGPTVVPDLGVLDLGFTPAFTVVQPAFFLGTNPIALSITAECGSALIGTPVYLQAVSFEVETRAVCISDGAVLDYRDTEGTCGATIKGKVFYDLDEDGIFDEDTELPLSGWRVELEGQPGLATAFTDAAGCFAFSRPLDGAAYTLRSIAPPPGYVGQPGGRWLATNPALHSVLADAPMVVRDFGLLSFENTPELARSKGYWHNQGASLLASCFPSWVEVVNDLCLRTNFSNPNGEEGTLFSVAPEDGADAAHQVLAQYLVGTPALGVLAFNLSVQFCAANLNRSCGPLQVTTYIDRFGDDVLVSFEEMAADTRALLCDPRSANTGPHGDKEWRDVVDACLMEWDGMNSNGDNIFTRTPVPIEFFTPY